MSRVLAADLRRLVGREAVVTDPDRLLPYESDGLTRYRHRPEAVVLPRDTEEAAAVLTLLHEAGVPVVPRGAGTGLSGGAVAVRGGVIVGTARMNRILALEPADRTARVQAGVINARLTEAARPQGLYYAPDPSSQSACTLGGNVAENSGGPHCLKYGVTSRYVSGLTMVLPTGEVAELGGAFRGPEGSDLVGLVVGSEGCFGLVTEIETRLLPVPEGVRTLLAIFDRIEDAGRAVTRVMASGLLPAALEIIDGATIRAVEASIFAAGYPVDAGAALVVEFDGTEAGLDDEARAAEAACRDEGAREVRRAATEEERAALWKGRKKAFGAMGRIAPDLMVQDATVPRSRLPEVLARIAGIAEDHGLTVANVFHAGDGNLHPNILFDRREEATVQKVEAASREIMRVCVEAGGTITGEHGVGLDKRSYMSLIHGPEELAAMAAVRRAFDPEGRFNPGKVLPDEVEPAALGAAPPAGRGAETEGVETEPGRGRGTEAEVAGDVDARRLVEATLGADRLIDPAEDGEAWPDPGGSSRVVALPRDAEEVAELVRAACDAGGAVRALGRGGWLRPEDGGARPELIVSTRRMERILEYEPDDLTVTAEAGLSLEALGRVTREHGQWLPADPPGGAAGTLGAIVAGGSDGFFSTRYGAVRDLVLGLTLVTGDGRVLRLGGRVVKNVAGFDLVRLAVGSEGTLGLVAEVTTRIFPVPSAVARLRARAERLEQLVPAARAVSRSPIFPAAVELREEAEGREGREAVLTVVLHGSAKAVEAEAGRALQVAPGLERVEPPEVGGDVRAPAPTARERPGDAAVLALRLPPSELDRLIAYGRRLVRAATDGSGGRPEDGGAFRVDPTRGLLRLRTTEPAARSSSPGRSSPEAGATAASAWTSAVEEVAEALREGGGGLTLEAGSASLSRAVSGRSARDAAAARLARRIRRHFDPAGILAAPPWRVS